MKKLFCAVASLVVATALCVSAMASELALFQTDLDHNIYTITSVQFDVAPRVDQSWYPLWASSLYLPIDVWWDDDCKSVVIHRSDRICVDQYYNAKRLFGNDEIVIVDGVTYCSPRLLSSFVSDISFVEDGRVFCFDGETIRSCLIYDAGNQKFRERILTSLFMAYRRAPGVYDMIIENLSGGFAYINEFDSSAPFGALGFVYPSSDHPICYIVGNHSGSTLLSLIAHESFHVYQYRNIGETFEKDAKSYERAVMNYFSEISI